MTSRIATALLVLALAPVASADETTFCNAYITAVPYTITAQGHYCFNKNLSTAITTGAAISINTDFVVLDLNNFKLGGGAAGLGTQAIGVRAVDRKNLTIRNGNIRGFQHGISIEETAPGASLNHLVENNVLDGNTWTGLTLEGNANVIRGNLVTNTGGTTDPAYAYGAYGISGYEAGFTLADANVVAYVSTYGYSAMAIALDDSAAVARANVIRLVPGEKRVGIKARLCVDNIVGGADEPIICPFESGNVTDIP